MPPDPSRSIGEYDLLEVIGAGGYATVWKAWHRRLDHHHAIKVLVPGDGDAEVDRERFGREGATMVSLRHDHIVPVYGAGVSEGNALVLPGSAYIVMDYVEGPDLLQHIRTPGVGPLSVTEAVRLGTEMASALAYVHERGIIHRDVKPANVLRRASDGRFFLTDFGIALRADHARLTSGGADRGMGTYLYFSPEQVSGDAEPATDLYGLGMVLFEALTMRLPFEGSTKAVLDRIVAEPAPRVRTHREDVPAWLDETIAACLAKRPSDRPPSAAALHQAFLRQQAVEGIRPPPEASGAAGAPNAEASAEDETVRVASGDGSPGPPPPPEATRARPDRPPTLPPPADAGRPTVAPRPPTAPPPPAASPYAAPPGATPGGYAAPPFAGPPAPPHAGALAAQPQVAYPPATYPPAAPRKSSAGLWVLSALLVLVIAGAGYYIATTEAPPMATMAPLSVDADAVVDAYLSRQESNDVAAVLALYADRVDYYGNTDATPQAIAEDKRTYFQRWPQRLYTLAGPVTATPRADGTTVIRFEYDFRVAGEPGEREGRAWAELDVRTAGRDAVIVAERGEVL